MLWLEWYPIWCPSNGQDFSGELKVVEREGGLPFSHALPRCEIFAPHCPDHCVMIPIIQLLLADNFPDSGVDTDSGLHLLFT